MDKEHKDKLVELENAKYELGLARRELHQALSDFVNDPYEENVKPPHG